MDRSNLPQLNASDPDRWESIGVLFDIDQLGETEEQQSSYGHQALLIFMRHLDPRAVGRAVLWHGDTAATLGGSEQRYAIAVTPENPAALTLIREVFSKVEDKGLAPLSQRFCRHPVDLDFSTGSPRPISREPLPLWFSLDDDGTCVITQLSGDDVALCSKFGWKFKLPDKVQALVAEIHEGNISPESLTMTDEMACAFQAIDLEVPGVPRTLLEYSKYFGQQCEQITPSSPPSSLLLQFPLMMSLGRLAELMHWSREKILARTDRDEVLSAIQYLGELSFGRESYERAIECFQRLEERAPENSRQKLDAITWRDRCLARMKKPESSESLTPQPQATQTDDIQAKHVNAEVNERTSEAVQYLKGDRTVYSTETTGPAGHGLDSTLKEPLCDSCGAGLSLEGRHTISPAEMRIIAGNGYGRHLKLWGDIAPSERESKFYQLAITKDTDWIVCPSCYQKTREYAVEQSDGLSHDDFRELLINLLWKSPGVTLPSSPSKAGMTTMPAPPPPLLDKWAPPVPVTAVYDQPETRIRVQPKAKRKRWQIVLMAITLGTGTVAATVLWWKYNEAQQQQARYIEAQTSFDQGLGYAKTGRTAEAAALFEKAVSLRPDFAEASAQLALAYEKLNRKEEAVRAAKRAVELKPGEAWTHRNLGEIYRRSERWDEAVAAYKKAVELKSDYPAAYNEMGFCYRKLKDPMNAIAAFKEAVRLKPDYAQAHFGLGLAYLDIDDHESASHEAETLKSLNRPDLVKILKKFISTGEPTGTSSEEPSNP